MMELGTFGAVRAFASQAVTQSAEFYETARERAKGPELKDVLKSLQDGANRDRATMEQTRRENVTEMILEPIAGLRREEYEARRGPSSSSVRSRFGRVYKIGGLLDARTSGL